MWQLNRHLGLGLNANYVDGFVEGYRDRIGGGGPEESVGANVLMAE